MQYICPHCGDGVEFKGTLLPKDVKCPACEVTTPATDVRRLADALRRKQLQVDRKVRRRIVLSVTSVGVVLVFMLAASAPKPALSALWASIVETYDTAGQTKPAPTVAKPEATAYEREFRCEIVHDQSGNVAPEPGTLALLAAGGVALLGYGWRRRMRVYRKLRKELKGE
jgi:hypothetical protein